MWLLDFVQEDEANIGALGEKDVHLLHLDSYQILVEDPCIQKLRFVDQLRPFLSVGDEVDVRALPLILTSFAIDGVIR